MQCRYIDRVRSTNYQPHSSASVSVQIQVAQVVGSILVSDCKGFSLCYLALTGRKLCRTRVDQHTFDGETVVVF